MRSYARMPICVNPQIHVFEIRGSSWLANNKEETEN